MRLDFYFPLPLNALAEYMWEAYKDRASIRRRRDMPAPGQDHSGDYGGRVPPVPIPNTEVKPPCAYGTAGRPGGRVGRRRNDRGLEERLDTSRVDFS